MQYCITYHTKLFSAKNKTTSDLQTVVSDFFGFWFNRSREHTFVHSVIVPPLLMLLLLSLLPALQPLVPWAIPVVSKSLMTIPSSYHLVQLL